MDISALKLEIIKKIIVVNDLELLSKIDAILESNDLISDIFNEPSKTYKEEEKVYILNEWQKARISVALKQVESGDYISDEEAQIEIEKWFEQQEK